MHFPDGFHATIKLYNARDEQIKDYTIDTDCSFTIKMAGETEDITITSIVSKGELDIGSLIIYVTNQKVVCKITNLSSHFSGYASSFCLYIRYVLTLLPIPFDYSYHSKTQINHLF